MSSARLGRPTGKHFPGRLPTSPRAHSTGRNDIRGREVDRHGNRDRMRDGDYRPCCGAPSLSLAPAHTIAPTPPMRTHRSMANMMSSRCGGPSSPSSSPAYRHFRSLAALLGRVIQVEHQHQIVLLDISIIEDLVDISGPHEGARWVRERVWVCERVRVVGHER